MADAELDTEMAEMTARRPRGSRKHVLDWTSGATFPFELADLVSPVPVVINPESAWMPRGYADQVEARLETFGPRVLPELLDVWSELRRWWLAHVDGANTPNWDVSMTATIEGQPGLVLVEAKANVPELGKARKLRPIDASSNSRANHDRIGAAIQEARVALSEQVPEIAITRDSHYQLSNRIAFMWKLASLGVPVVLVYLGFTGDTGIADAGEPFVDDAHWRSAFASYAGDVVPYAHLAERRLDCGRAPAWFLIRWRPILEQSPAAVSKRVAPPV